jgi:transcriptional regulator with GAF, ATPase, and Fis domain
VASAPQPPREEETATYVRGRHLRGPRRPLGAVLRVLDARATPAELRLSGGSVLVGGAPPSDLIIHDATVSRQHVELTLVPEGVAVHDLGSRNGTFYLGQRVEKMILAFGARLSVGKATLAVEADTGALRDDLELEDDTYRGMVGASPAMRRIFAMLARLEGSLVTVLVEGESGVGKEGIARALHEGSPAAAGPLVVVNCGALPRELIGSELFGHKKGAFTGASEARLGAFESADGGTLFLDEIGELPLDVQPMLLRALEAGEIRPVGDDRPRRVKVRVIAATNRDLAAESASGGFREDLFYRLAVVRLKVPPLRERIDDLEPLARRFAAAAGVADLPSDVVEQLKARAWPGNARELRNAMQAYAALGILPDAPRSKADVLDLVLGEMVDLDRPYAELKDEVSDRFTRVYLRALLARTGGNQTAAARLAGLDRGYLGRLAAKLGVGPKG